MTISAWDYVTSMDDDRIMEGLLANEQFHLEYLMDPPPKPKPGSTIFHVSCHTISIPHIVYLTQSIFTALGLDFITMGGPENCCGSPQWSRGEEIHSKQVANLTLGAFRRVQPIQVVSTCPDCDLIFLMHKNSKLYKYKQMNEIEVLYDNLDKLKTLMTRPVNKTVVIHYHAINDRRTRDHEAAVAILSAVPGLTVKTIAHEQGYGNHCLVKTGRYDNTVFSEKIKGMFREAEDVGADTLAVLYHGCYRQYLRFQLQHKIDVRHYLSIIADSIGLPYQERLKELRLLDDVTKATDAVMGHAAELGYDRETVERVIRSKVYVS